MNIQAYIKDCVKIFAEPPKNPYEFILNKFTGFGSSLFRYTSCNHMASNLDEELTYFNEPQFFNDPFDCNFDSDLNNILMNSIRKFLFESPQGKDLTAIIKNGQYRQIKSLLASQPNLSNVNVDALDFIKDLYDGKTVDMEKFPALIGSDFDIPKTKEQIKETFEIVNNYINQMFRIACFTTTNSNSLMWSHYADKHTGYCIEYDITKFDFKFILLLFPVVYSDKRYIMPFENYFDYAKMTIIDNFYEKHSFLENIIEGLLTKSRVWGYENEWRIVLLQEQEHLFKLPIKGVYLGAKITDENKAKIYDYQRKHGFFVKEFILDKNEYKLNIIDRKETK